MAFHDELMVGVSINNLTGITGERYTIADMVNAARKAENVGLHGVWVHDAPLGRRTMASYDAVPILSAIAAVTTDLKLCTGVLQPHLRNPVSLALEWATLQNLSGGRAIMGVGTGAGKPSLVKRQYEALAALRHDSDLDPDRLYARMGAFFVEHMKVMNLLWEQDKVTFHGEFFHFDEVTLGEARPAVKPPTLMGSGIYVPREYGGPAHHLWNEQNAGRFLLGRWKRVVNVSDGWLSVHATPDEFAESCEKIEDYAHQTKPDQQFARGFNCAVYIADDERTGWNQVKGFLNDWHTMIADDVVDRWAVAGPPEVVAQRLNEYRERGANIFQLLVAAPGDPSKQIELIGEKVLPLLR